MTRRTGWAVTTGDYSDYQVHVVFTNQEEAKKLLSMKVDSSYLPVRVEEFPICDTADEAVLGERWMGRATWSGHEWSFTAELRGVALMEAPPETEPRSPIGGGLVCFGKSEEQVLKALSDYIAAEASQ